ncbi:hypothetical protein [Cupriavidus necator]
MKISLGNFGNVVARPAPQINVPDGASGEQISRAAGNLGRTVAQIGTEMANEQQRLEDDLARSKSVLAYQDHELNAKTALADSTARLQSGQIDRLAYLAEVKDTLFKSQNDTIGALPDSHYRRVAQEQANGIERGVLLQADAAIRQDQQREFATNAGALLDRAGKLAGLPGADVAAINETAGSAYAQLAREAGIPLDKATKTVQDWRDANWGNQAMGRLGAARDMESLTQLRHDLTAADGFYADKLDSGKRTQVLNAVEGRIYQLDERQARAQDRRDAKANRALDEMDKQAASGEPPTLADQERWRAMTLGTPAEAEYQSRVNEMNEVQKLLRSPLDVQERYLAQKRDDMAKNGASVRDQANMDRLTRAIEENKKLMREQPLLFSARRTGTDLAPLDLSAVLQPGGAQQVGEQLRERFDTVAAVRRQYGPEVAMNPWRPEEATALKAFMQAAPDAGKLTMLSMIAAASPSGKSYRDALAPLAADQPITVLAGMARYRGLQGDAGTDVAGTLLLGAKVLADKSVNLPSDSKLQADFSDGVGTALPQGSTARQEAFLAFKAMYAGMASQSGVKHDGTNPEVNTFLASQALGLATGGIIEYAGAKVVKPYGMPDADFTDRVAAQIELLAYQSGLAGRALRGLPLVPVPNAEGSYYLQNGRQFQANPRTGQPLIVKVR